MTRLTTFSLALLFAAPAAAQDQQSATPIIQAPAAIGAKANEQPDVVRKIVECEGEKFVFAWGAGSNPTKVTLCSDKGADADGIVTMLDDAAAKIERTASIPEDRRIVLVQQIRGKIAEVKAREAAAKPAAQPAIAQGSGSALKPAPISAAASSPLLLPKPRLAFDCYTPGDLGSGGPCVIFTRDTRLTVKAGEAIPAATSLRFIRRGGDTRAEVPLGPLRKGQLARLGVPQEVCGGVVETEIEIQVARGGYAVDRRGPYLMRC